MEEREVCPACNRSITRKLKRELSAAAAATAPVGPERIKALRMRLGLTQEAFAARLGLNRVQISHWETGTPPRRRNLAALRRLAEQNGVEL